jgi:hypothetical protein
MSLEEQSRVAGGGSFFAAEGVKPLVGSARLPLCDVLNYASIEGKVSRTLRHK